MTQQGGDREVTANPGGTAMTLEFVAPGAGSAPGVFLYLRHYK